MTEQLSEVVYRKWPTERGDVTRRESLGDFLRQPQAHSKNKTTTPIITYKDT